MLLLFVTFVAGAFFGWVARYCYEIHAMWNDYTKGD